MILQCRHQAACPQTSCWLRIKSLHSRSDVQADLGLPISSEWMRLEIDFQLTGCLRECLRRMDAARPCQRSTWHEWQRLRRNAKEKTVHHIGPEIRLAPRHVVIFGTWYRLLRVWLVTCNCMTLYDIWFLRVQWLDIKSREMTCLPCLTENVGSFWALGYIH